MGIFVRNWLAGCVALSLSQISFAAGTDAGTDITNTATASFTNSLGASQSVDSNTTTLKVDELLDVTVTSNDSGNVSVVSDETGAVLSFTVTNTGNGEENYDLDIDSALTGDDFDPENVQIYIDANGNGSYDPGTDTLFTPGSSAAPLLDADGAITVFLVSDIPDALSNGDTGLVELTVESVTAQANAGAEVPGYVFAGQGDGGGDAVVGSSTALVSEQNAYLVAQVETTFTKNQSIADPFGGTSAVQGSIITYTLTFESTGTGTITGLVLSDNIPDNTSYVAGSITLDSTAKTDASGDDEATFESAASPQRIDVNLGDVTPPTTHTVTFQVQID